MTGRTVDLSEYTPRGSARNNEYITNQMTFIGYNTANPLLSGVETRQGLSNIVDKDRYCKFNDISRGKASNIPVIRHQFSIMTQVQNLSLMKF